MTELLRVGVKQIEMAFNCPRKWAYHYLEGVPQLEGENLAVGNALHEQMKRIIRGEVPAYGPETFIGKMARELMMYAEPRSQLAVSEIIRQVEMPEYGIKVDLRCDFMDMCPLDSPVPIFKDWKTTGAPSKTAKLKTGRLWALNDLTDDFQANIYAFLLMHAHWKVNEVNAEWCFVSKKFSAGQTPRTWTVPHHFTYEVAKAWFEKYCMPTIQLIRDMREAWKEKALDSARVVPHNPVSCEFSGHFCDAAGHCGFISSPIGDYKSLHLPVLKGKQ